jgi:gliding motility-associated-like protein
MKKRYSYIFFILVIFLIFFNVTLYAHNTDCGEITCTSEPPVEGLFKSSCLCALPILPPPELRCVSVLANGNVTLSWKVVFDTMSSFNSYHIYSSVSPSGPFIEIDSIFNILQTTYTDITANANTKIIYYYIKTRSSCGGIYYSSPSDTLQTMLMNATNTGLGTAALSWNPIHSPDLQSSYNWYHIYREYPPGTWIMIDSTQMLNYNDTITVCDAHINYYVEINDSLPCTSASSIDGDRFQDAIAPVTPVIDSVSVDSLNGHSIIGWTASPSGDTHGYIIYESKNGIWVPIDTVYGQNTTSYLNTNPHWANPDSSSLSYCVAAFDSCRNTSPISLNQSTIFLTSSIDICGSGVTLNWTPYINMHPGLKGYKIFVRQNNGVLTLLGTNPPTNQSFVHSPLTQNSVYIYSIQAFDSTGTITSTSNSDTILAYSPMQPKFVYLRYATVRNNDYIEIRALIDTTGYISKCKILRADDITGPFAYIGSIIPMPLSNMITYNDHSALVNKQSYFYKVIVVDSCGNDVDTSNIGRSIFLEAKPTSDLQNILSWNEYELWLGSVKSYDVYREVDGVWEPNPITTLTPGTVTYTDDISSFTSTEGKFGYLIVATEGPGNPYLFADTSTSNEAISIQPPRLYVPNAFVPKGVNKVFLPLNVFVNSEDYQFSIYSNWGLPVFQTSDTKSGWDGTYQGSLAPGGVYVYVIKFKNSQGEMMVKRGTVSLLR